ncbi:MAG: hypothetical protein FD167_4087, partial [bacterium]
MTEERFEQDNPWKEAIEKYFPEFIALLFPHVYKDIDWEKGWESLDNELQQVVRDAEVGTRRVDKLVKVWRKNGKEQWVLIHIEIQAQKDEEFPERIFVYNYRIFDRYKQPVASFAVLIDSNKSWRPTNFEYELWGSRHRLDFVTVKLLDYKKHLSELEMSDNPFAIVILAQLQT